MKLYYTVKLSFDGQDDVEIGKEDLEYALYAFMGGGNVILSSGAAIRGKDIISILPDYNKMMGYNRGYKLNPEDWNHVEKEIGNVPKHFLAGRKEVIEHLIKTGNNNLIGKNKELGEIVSQREVKLV